MANPKTTRIVKNLKSSFAVAYLLPRNFLVIFVLFWRKFISPLYGDVCRYYPSCSSYGLSAIQQYGFFWGSLKTILRILRCNPFARGGIDEVPARMDGNFPLSRLGFVQPKKKDN